MILQILFTKIAKTPAKAAATLTTTIASDRGLIAYAFDPSLDELGLSTPADDDFLHNPDEKHPQQHGLLPISWRGVFNVLTLVALMAALLCLFVVYPVIRFYHDNDRNILITFNTRINHARQASNIVLLNRQSQFFFLCELSHFCYDLIIP